MASSFGSPRLAATLVVNIRDRQGNLTRRANSSRPLRRSRQTPGVSSPLQRLWGEPVTIVMRNHHWNPSVRVFEVGKNLKCRSLVKSREGVCMLAVRLVCVAALGAMLSIERPRASEPPEGAADNWAQWRGPLATGEAPQGDPPLAWNEADGKNISWKTAIPGRGHSSPIVWGDRIFLTTAIAVGDALPPRPSTAPGNHDNLPVTHRHRFVALAVSRSSGKILWQKTLREAVPARTGTLHRQPGVELAGERRPARVRVLRLVRALLSRPRRRAGMESGLRPDAIAARARRGKLAGALRRHACGQLGPRGEVIYRGARQKHGRREMESAAE